MKHARLELECVCGGRVAGDVAGSASLTCAGCGATWLVGASLMARPPVELVGAYVFPRGRGVEHDVAELADHRTACGLELVGAQLVLASGRRCSWCRLAGTGHAEQLRAAT